jgi:hypothetical protein
MKILQAPSNIANQPWALAQGLRALGHEAEVWHYGPNPFAFPNDRQVDFPQVPGTKLLPLVAEAIERFDVIHLHNGRSLLPRQIDWLPGLWDLPLLREARKKIFMTFHGSDVRLRSKHLDADPWSYFRFADVPCDEDEITKRLQVVRTYARMFVCSPVNRTWVPDAAFHPRAVDLRDWPYSDPPLRDVPLVVHVPSRRGTKGTDAVLKAVEAARDAGARFEFRLIEGVPNASVKQILQDADILVDNLLLGDYEVTGLEAMALGRTVISRVTPVVAETIGRDIPVLHADPDSFADVLARAVADPDLRAATGKASRAFVEEVHDAPVVAKRLVEAYERDGDVPPVGFPDWASLGESRRVERLEAELTELTAAVRAQGREVILAGTKRGPFTLIGARIDRFLRRLKGSR